MTSRPQHRFPCRGCGADLAFTPGLDQLQCDYCGRTESIPRSEQAIKEYVYDDYLLARRDQPQPLEHQPLEVQCRACGATVAFAATHLTHTCDFCGAAIIEPPSDAEPIDTPAAVLPFRIGHDAAAAAIKAWRSKLWFAPTALTRLASDRPVAGVYLPFLTYDALAISHYRGARGDYYYVQVPRTVRDQHGRTRQVMERDRRTRWTTKSGVVERWFDDVLIPATDAITESKLDALRPWDMAALVPYRSDFLAGFKAQRPTLAVADGFVAAKARMGPQIREDICRELGGDTQRVDSIESTYLGIAFKHILLPVWLASYRYRDRPFQVLVNASTGEVHGERPWSPAKLAAAALLAIAIVAAIASLA